MKVKEKIELTVRGFQLIHQLSKGLLMVSMLRSLTGSLLPFINIYMSARILNALVMRQGLNQLLLLAAITVTLNFAVNTINGLFSLATEYYEDILTRKCDNPQYDKIRKMDYECVEDSKIQERFYHLMLLRASNGMGIMRLYWSLNDGIGGMFTMVFSVVLTVGAFLSVPKNIPEWSVFLFTPWCTMLMLAFILCSVLLDIYRATGATKALATIFSSFTTSNRIGMYYMENLYYYKAGKDLKLYHMENIVEKELKEVLTVLTKKFGKFQQLNALFECAGAINSTVFGAVVYIYIALKALVGSFGIGSIVQYVGALSKFGGGIAAAARSVSMLMVNAEILQQLFWFLDMPDEKYQGTLPVEKRADNEYEIEFCNVSFCYPGSNRMVLEHINLKFRIGRKMAVVGTNGSGKTTMIKLLCRLYDPTEGIITLNGIDIRKYDYKEYLDLFSVVFQDFKLFSFSLAENVAASTEYEADSVHKCLVKAGFKQRVEKMNKGILTPLYKNFEEDGVEISGGEAQKIALARALYKDAPFVILDEPTAALDPISEYEIYARFNDMVEQKTAVYISHRLSSCRFCDDISVFDKGQLIQRGSHETLVADKSGKYYELWNAQAKYYQEKSALT